MSLIIYFFYYHGFISPFFLSILNPDSFRSEFYSFTHWFRAGYGSQIEVRAVMISMMITPFICFMLVRLHFLGHSCLRLWPCVYWWAAIWLSGVISYPAAWGWTVAIDPARDSMAERRRPKLPGAACSLCDYQPNSEDYQY